MRAADEVHNLQREILQLDAGELQLHESETQVIGILHIKAQLRADQQNQPAQIRPQQSGYDDRKSRVDNRQASRIDDEGGEQLTNGRPDDACGDAADQRRRDFDFGIRYKQIQNRKDQRHHRIRGGLHAERKQRVDDRQIREALHRGVGQGDARQAEKAHQRQRTENDQRQIFGDTPREAARLLHTPQKIEAAFDFFDGVDERPQQQCESDRADDAAGNTIGKFHHLVGQFGRGVTDGAKKLEDDRLEIVMQAEGLEHREAEGNQRYQRHYRREHQAHRPQIDLAARQVAQQSVWITQQTNATRQGPAAIGPVAEQKRVDKIPQDFPHTPL